MAEFPSLTQVMSSVLERYKTPRPHPKLVRMGFIWIIKKQDPTILVRDELYDMCTYFNLFIYIYNNKLYLYHFISIYTYICKYVSLILKTDIWWKIGSPVMKAKSNHKYWNIVRFINDPIHSRKHRRTKKKSKKNYRSTNPKVYIQSSYSHHLFRIGLSTLYYGPASSKLHQVTLKEKHPTKKKG